MLYFYATTILKLSVRQEAGAKLEISEGENLNYSAELLKSKDKGPFKYFKEHLDEAEKYGRTEVFSYILK